MKRILFLLLFLQSISLIAQIKTKKVEIFSSTAGEFLNAQITIEPEKENLTEIQFLGRDHQYQQINEYLTFFYGSPKDFYTFLYKLKDAFNEDIDVTITINNCLVTSKKMMGKNVISITPKNKTGYRLFNLKTIEKIIGKYEVWAIENKIEIK
jgi:hypothetical protein